MGLIISNLILNVVPVTAIETYDRVVNSSFFNNISVEVINYNMSKSLAQLNSIDNLLFIPNKVDYNYASDSEKLTLTTLFDGSEDEYLQIQMKVNSTNLIEYPFLGLTYSVENRKFQTVEILFSVDLTGDDIPDVIVGGVTQGIYEKPVPNGKHDFKFNALNIVKNAYPNQSIYRLTHVNIVPHKIWGLDLSGNPKDFSFLFYNLTAYRGDHKTIILKKGYYINASTDPNALFYDQNWLPQSASVYESLFFEFTNGLDLNSNNFFYVSRQLSTDKEYIAYLGDRYEKLYLDENFALLSKTEFEKDDIQLNIGSFLDLGNNYSLKVQDISPLSRDVYFILSRDDKKIIEQVLSNKELFKYSDEVVDDEVTLFAANIDQVFSGENSSFVRLKSIKRYNVLKLNNGDTIQDKFKLHLSDFDSDGFIDIVLCLKDSEHILLEKGEKTNILHFSKGSYGLSVSKDNDFLVGGYMKAFSRTIEQRSPAIPWPNYTIYAMDAPGLFYYNIDKNIGGESLYLDTHNGENIDDQTFEYRSVPFQLDGRCILSYLGNQYYIDSINKERIILKKLIINENNKILKKGESWDIGKYRISLLDTSEDEAFLKFYNDSELLKEEIVKKGEIFSYKINVADIKDVEILNATLKSIINGRNESLIQLYNISLYDDNVLTLRDNSEFDKDFEIYLIKKNESDEIYLSIK